MPFLGCEGDRMMYRCDACPAVFQMGRGRYDGTYLVEVDMTVCRACGPDDKSDRARVEAVVRLRGRAGQ